MASGQIRCTVFQVQRFDFPIPGDTDDIKIVVLGIGHRRQSLAAVKVANEQRNGLTIRNNQDDLALVFFQDHLIQTIDVLRVHNLDRLLQAVGHGFSRFLRAAELRRKDRVDTSHDINIANHAGQRRGAHPARRT